MLMKSTLSTDTFEKKQEENWRKKSGRIKEKRKENNKKWKKMTRRNSKGEEGVGGVGGDGIMDNKKNTVNGK